MGILSKPQRIVEVKDKLGRVHKYTNKHNLPPEVVAAILKDRYNDLDEEPSDFSASRLVQPIQKTILEKRYADTGKLKMFDVVDQFHSFKGAVGHQVMEDSWHETMGGIVEERLYMIVHGKTISGKMDRYHSGRIKDYKNTSVYKIQKGKYGEWELQQNIYGQLCRENDWEIESIEIIAMLDDWKEGQLYKVGYPDCPIQVIPLQLWPEEKIKAWIEQRVSDLLEAEHMDDALLSETYPCSDEERWKNFKDWVVVRKGKERATKVFESEETGEQEALEHIKEKGYEETHEVKKRTSPPKRCIRYCAASSVCVQNAQWLTEQEKEEDKPLF